MRNNHKANYSKVDEDDIALIYSTNVCEKHIAQDVILTATVKIMMDESHALREHIERASNMGVRSQATLNSEAWMWMVVVIIERGE